MLSLVHREWSELIKITLGWLIAQIYLQIQFFFFLQNYEPCQPEYLNKCISIKTIGNNFKNN